MIHSKNVLLPRRRLVAEWCNKNVVENRHRKRLFLLRTCFPTPYITSFDPVRTCERSLFWKLTWGPVRIVEDLPYGFALGRLREPDHVVRRADLHKREPGLRIFGCYEIRGKTDISIWNILLQIKWEMNFKIPIELPQWDLTYGAMMSQKHYLRARWWFYEFVWSQSGWNILVKAFWSGSHQTKVDYSQKWRSSETIF